MLSVRLYEEKIVLLDSEVIEHPKTKFLSEIIKPFNNDRILMVTSFDPCTNFMRAQQNISNFTVVNPQQIHVDNILHNDWIFLTFSGLKELEMIIENRHSNLYRNRKVPRAVLPFDNILYSAVNRKEKKRDMGRNSSTLL
jgi:hypothetical protein